MKRRLLTMAVAGTLSALAPEALASDPPPTLGVGIGYVRADSVDPTIVFAGDFRFFVSKNIALSPEISYWKKSSRSAGIAASLKDLQFGVNLLAVLRPFRTVEFYGGGGGGVHQVGADVAISTIQASETITKAGLDVTGGMVLEVADDVGFFMAGRYDWVLDVGGSDPGRLDQHKFYGGFRLRF